LSGMGLCTGIPLFNPPLLDNFYRLKSNPNVFFAGQITGVEGYVESASSGLLAGLNLARILKNETPIDFTESYCYRCPGSLCLPYRNKGLSAHEC
jgi:folate-dependent tRNA-U54 methylase TrmFO/GidA